MRPSIKLDWSKSDQFKDFVLKPDALDFLVHLKQKFQAQRNTLLSNRKIRQKEWDRGQKPTFLASTQEIRNSPWQTASTPHDLQDRRVEITGPAERKMMIHALNSRAKVFMADLEDACAPSWQNILQSHDNLIRAVRRNLDFSVDGKEYKLNAKTATLMVRPRGWHLDEVHFLIDDEPISASLFDFGLFFFNNAHELLKRNSGPYFYLPKLENHLEARLWQDVFQEAEAYLGLPHSTIRATVLIETITAAYEMEEILWELKHYITALNAGRWDYIFSLIKKFGKDPEHVLPDRQQVTMAVPFMRNYAQLLVQTCHKRGAHAMGGMSAFIPNRKDPELNERALTAVRLDKERETKDGFDGTWVAHPDLIGVAEEVFNKTLGQNPHQKNRLREDVYVEANQLLDTKIPNSYISIAGVRSNISVALQYINKWLLGTGAVAINNLMEDAATAEISRTQIWQWLFHKSVMQDGRRFTREIYEQVKEEELRNLIALEGPQQFPLAAKIFHELVGQDECPDFLTIPAYRYLQNSHA